MGISPASISYWYFQNLVKSFSSFISPSFCCFSTCFISKSSLSRIFGIFGKLNIIFSSETISSFVFFFFDYLFKLVVFVPKFDKVLAVFIPTFDEFFAVDDPFGKNVLANPLSEGGSGAGGRKPLEKSKLKSLLLRNWSTLRTLGM